MSSFLNLAMQWKALNIWQVANPMIAKMENLTIFNCDIL